MSDKLRGGTTIGGYLAYHAGNLNIGDGVGKISFFTTTKTPKGYLRANGASYDPELFPELAARIGTMYSADGNSYKLPDMRGIFPRGFSDGNSIDVSREFGSTQGFAIQNITGRIASVQRGGFANSGNTGAFGGQGYSASNLSSGTNYTVYRYLDFDASLVAATADETRPINMALLACIKY